MSLSPGLEEHLSGSGLEHPPIMPAMLMIMLKMIMVRKDRDDDDMLISCGHKKEICLKNPNMRIVCYRN